MLLLVPLFLQPLLFVANSSATLTKFWLKRVFPVSNSLSSVTASATLFAGTVCCCRCRTRFIRLSKASKLFVEFSLQSPHYFLDWLLVQRCYIRQHPLFACIVPLHRRICTTFPLSAIVYINWLPTLAAEKGLCTRRLAFLGLVLFSSFTGG